METQYFTSLLNTTINSLVFISGETLQKESAKLIASGIYKSIGKHRIAREFEQYCQAVYDIDILI